LIIRVPPEVELWTAVSITVLGCGLIFREDLVKLKKPETGHFLRGTGFLRETHLLLQSGEHHRFGGRRQAISEAL